LIFILLAVFLGPYTLSAVNLIPLSILGVLLLFAGSQLGLTIIDLQGRQEYFVILVILGITLASNLAAGFIVGVAVAHILSMERFEV
jgi:SulP family sulfate permease